MNLTILNQLACSTCATAFEHASGDQDAAGWAILFMLVVIVPMLTVIGFFIFRIARREKAAFDPQYQDNFES
ncbi:hypothetical protein SAMN02745181_3094 [Rubritalea squalenifaciens DSM 18772]|uniref:Uncharacterized protein n=1 Tax=Rubritalea squalenifaciens DSM 18772 TaxID=1123071 RepID=A0A1M6P745_9BACT|nr:hypothetical protein [Rubritalea squalenifaciens]SHK03752.1 hypothetical protein SAMN02745181_3094 [Rubritalea squalenifaciens DSM 18772]